MVDDGESMMINGYEWLHLRFPEMGVAIDPFLDGIFQTAFEEAPNS